MLFNDGFYNRKPPGSMYGEENGLRLKD